MFDEHGIVLSVVSQPNGDLFQKFFLAIGGPILSAVLTATATSIIAYTGWKFAEKQAEKKFQTDKQLNASRRKFEIAESVLADFYEVEKIFFSIRSPLVSGEEMKSEEGVDEKITSRAEYGVLRRMRRYSDFFSKFESKKYTFAALFGSENLLLYDDVIRSYNEIYHAITDMIWLKDDRSQAANADYLRECRAKIFSSSSKDKDEIALRLRSVVGKIEAVCKPSLEC